MCRNTQLKKCRYIVTLQLFWFIYYPSIEFVKLDISLYRVSQEEWTKLREDVPYVKLYRYNPKHLYPKLNGYGDNGQRSLKL